MVVTMEKRDGTAENQGVLRLVEVDFAAETRVAKGLKKDNAIGAEHPEIGPGDQFWLRLPPQEFPASIHADIVDIDAHIQTFHGNHQ
jgi:hypothetical protein